MNLTFIIGGWYKSPKWSNFYIKVDSFDGKTIKTSCHITNNSYVKLVDNNYNCSIETYTEVPLSEIVHMLPDYEKRNLVIDNYEIY